MQISTNEVYLQVALILCQNIRKLLWFMAKLYNWSPGLCGALSTTSNGRTFGLIIGKISEAKQNNKTYWSVVQF